MKIRHRFFQKALNPVLTAPLLAVLLSVLFVGTALSDPLQLQAAFDNITIYSEQPAPHYLEILVTASTETDTMRKRLPLNLALVIDTSGSMRDENKLNSVKQAAIALVNRLRPEDRLAIISYDTQAKVVLPSSPVQVNQEARWLIQSLRADGGTNLGAGLIEAIISSENLPDCEPLAGCFCSPTVRPMWYHVLCRAFSYGFAGADAGISLSTFGVGLDFNEDLMAALSESGRGMYYFIDRPESMEAILAKEFNSVEQLVAADIKATITLTPDFLIEQVFANTFEVNGNTVSVRFGDLAAGERRRMQIRFQPRQRGPGAINNAATVQVSYSNPGGGGSGSMSRSIGLTYIRNQQAIAENLNHEITERSAVFEANLARKEAALAVDRGETKHADSILNLVKKKIKGLAGSSNRVQQEVSDMESYQKGLEKPMPARERALLQKQVKHKSQALEGY
ncbi:von Willebrand factor type A domain-containing protein [Candidatus Electrothrix aarhusensis]|uniref:von Willebrand factor type A domain-containing protein n=1 Tax=Candidatus Electrothrix aarhusensis TaxID=1859131 RepID=A0A3S3QJU7_9BACT|nr:von Willebrand factor type A domain-containing protein [Candidatus Electrothrix aarhusensis]